MEFVQIEPDISTGRKRKPKQKYPETEEQMARRKEKDRIRARAYRQRKKEEFLNSAETDLLLKAKLGEAGITTVSNENNSTGKFYF